MKNLLSSLLVLSSVSLAQVVPWRTETARVPSNQAGDPALAFVPTDVDAGVSLLVGTDTAQVGVYGFELDGVLRQTVPLGLVNGADTRGDLVVVTGANGGLFSFQLTDAGLVRVDPQLANVPTPNRVALSALDDGGFELWTDTSSTRLAHFTIERRTSDFLYTRGPDVLLPETPSGLAADDRTGRLFVTLPTKGLFVLEPDATLEQVVSIETGRLGPVVGGVDVVGLSDGGVLAFTTSPSTDKVIVHAVAGLQATLVASFEVGAPDGGAVRARSPKHLDLTGGFPDFPLGALVLHDGVSANYKLVSLLDVAPLVPELLDQDAGVSDGGVTDAGVADAGTRTDAGTGGGTGGTGRPGGTGSTPPDEPSGCGCTDAPFALLPALLLLWSIRRPRS